MKKIATCVLFLSSTLFAQTADIGYFRAVMLPSNEVPALPSSPNISGVATIIAHVVRDNTGQITSGTVQFLVRPNAGTAFTATGLHIHAGGPTIAGPVVIGTALSGTNTLPVPVGVSTINLPVQVTGESVALTNLRGLFNDPSQFYVNLHTTDFSGGIMRGQLVRAVGTVLMGVMSSDNEVPPTGVGGRGFATVVAIATYNSLGALESGETYLQTTYQIDDGGTFSGFHIHNGPAGMNAGVIINTGVAAAQNIAVNPNGGVLGPYYVEIDKNAANGAVQVATFNSLFTNPSGNYINAHTVPAHAGGAIRAQLRNTDNIVFPVFMDSAKEPTNVISKGTGPALISLRTLRNEDGTVAAGTVFFDVNYRFAEPQSFTGLHIHDEPSGAISINMVPAADPVFSSPTGFGNYFNWVPVSNLGTLEDIVKNPENHYVNIHSTTDPGGAARAQLGTPLSGPAQIEAVIAANNDKTATTVAPGGLISIYGQRLVKVASGLEGWEGRTLPTSFNGTTVTIGGRPAPIVYVGPGQINAQVPVDIALGQQPVVVNNSRGPSPAFMVNLAQVAPAIFFSPVPAVLKNSDFSLVSASNPVKAGDVILIYATGFGQTTPATPTGALVTGTANTTPVTATVGTRTANVVYSIASPGFAGLNQVALTIPEGVSGNVPVVLTQGTAKSNTINIQVQ
jgi:uncharacterized protein (TIGR03437 family)